jgi:torulene dioxygenase
MQWFDGFQETHRFELTPSSSGVKVHYNSRMVCDLIIQEIEKEGKWNSFTFAQKRDPCVSFFGKVMSSFHAVAVEVIKHPLPDPAAENVCVTFSINMPGLPTTEGTIKAHSLQKAVANGDTSMLGHASGIQSLYTTTDGAVVKQLDPKTLEPLGIARHESLHPSLKGPMCAAHARVDPVTGDLFNFNLDFVFSPTYRVYCVSASTGKTSILATIKGRGVHAAYIHSLFLTPDYVILCVWGSSLGKGGASVVWHLNILDAIQPTDPSIPTKWFVVDRHHGRGVVAEFESPAMFAFHTINAWQDEEKNVIAELTEYSSTDILHKFYYEAIKSSSPAAHTLAKKKLPSCQPHLTRYRLSAEHISTKPIGRSKPHKAEVIFKMSGGELPTINNAYALRPHRYVYSVADRGLSTFFDGLAKMDTETGKTVYWENEVGHTPSEAIFIANPEGESEDDGVLLSVVLDGSKGSSYLLALDAGTMREVGRAEVSGAIGFGFHGAYNKNLGDV